MTVSGERYYKDYSVSIGVEDYLFPPIDKMLEMDFLSGVLEEDSHIEMYEILDAARTDDHTFRISVRVHFSVL